MKYAIKTEGMGCGRCIARMTDAMNALGARTEKVELNDIIIEADCNEAAIREAIENLGFDVLSVERV